jgi:hypothetical protein
MKRILEQLFNVGHFDDVACVHHSHSVADLGDHR